jgi:hypothetical protein
MTNILDLQGLSIESFGEYCPSSKSVVIVVTTFRA